jgi:hypothetical protein
MLPSAKQEDWAQVYAIHKDILSPSYRQVLKIK